MNGTRDSHTKWSKSERERQIPYDITYIWNLIYGANDSFYRKENHGHGEQTCGCQGGGSGIDWEFGVEMQTIAFGMDEHWDPAVQRWELYLVTCDGTWWRIMGEKEYICVCMCMTGSLCCTVEIDRTL